MPGTLRLASRLALSLYHIHISLLLQFQSLTLLLQWYRKIRYTSLRNAIWYLFESVHWWIRHPLFISGPKATCQLPHTLLTYRLGQLGPHYWKHLWCLLRLFVSPFCPLSFDLPCPLLILPNLFAPLCLSLSSDSFRVVTAPRIRLWMFPLGLLIFGSGHC